MARTPSRPLGISLRNNTVQLNSASLSQCFEALLFDGRQAGRRAGFSCLSAAQRPSLQEHAAGKSEAVVPRQLV